MKRKLLRFLRVWVSSSALAVVFLLPEAQAQQLSLPGDLRSFLLLNEEYDLDSATFTPLRYSGILEVPNGTIVNRGPIFNAPLFFPYVLLDSARNTLLLHPGTFETLRRAAILGVVVVRRGTYSVAGAFARANNLRNAGDGVRVVIFRNFDFSSPLFDAFISSDHDVNPDRVFSGTGVARFNFTVTAAAGEVLRFGVLSGPDTLDGTFDVTALRATISKQ